MICKDAELAEDLFADKREAFELGWYLGSMRKREEEYAALNPSPTSWGPHALYGRESSNRRVMFLELMAWAILHVEGFATNAEANAFFKELRETRAEHWGDHPWAYAARGASAYYGHVRDMADVFAHAATAEEANYPRRQKQPVETETVAS